MREDRGRGVNGVDGGYFREKVIIIIISIRHCRIRYPRENRGKGGVDDQEESR